MKDDADKLADRIIGHVQRYIRNGNEPKEAVCEVERTDESEDEIELAFTLERDRYYLRLRKADLLRLMQVEADHE